MAAPHLQCVKPRRAWRAPREWSWLAGQPADFRRERLRLWPAIFTRGKARRPGFRSSHGGFDQSRKALRKQFCWGSRLYFSCLWVVSEQVPGMWMERKSEMLRAGAPGRTGHRGERGRLRRGFDSALIKLLGLRPGLGTRGRNSIPSLPAVRRLAVWASCSSCRVLLESSPQYVTFAHAAHDPAGS